MEPTKEELENSRSFDVHRWSDYSEVNTAVDYIFDEIKSLGDIKKVHPERSKKYVKVVILDLYVCYLSDPTQYIGYPRNNSALGIDRYNKLHIKVRPLSKTVDWFVRLGYVENWTPKPGALGMQSRMRATPKLIKLIVEEHQISPLMVKRYKDAPDILMRDENKKLAKFTDTDESLLMADNLKIINNLLQKTFINLYLSDDELEKLNRRMIKGEIGADEDEEIPRGAIDFTRKHVYRVFNNKDFAQGGRFYGGFWQAMPREYRKYIRINRMNTKEIDFSAIHLNLIYWKAGLPVPEDDPYTLEGFPDGTRDVVKQCLLTIINDKSPALALKSINERINGVKYRQKYGRKIKQIIDLKDCIVVPDGTTIEKIIEAFEKKHEAIKDEYFYSRKGVFLQKDDSRIAEEIMVTLAGHGVPCLPLHDSFIVSEPQEGGLREIMLEAFKTITGRYPKVDAKMSLYDENVERGAEVLEAEYQVKMEGGSYSERFKQEYSTYYNSIVEWKKATGRDNILIYGRLDGLNSESYKEDIPITTFIIALYIITKTLKPMNN